MPDIREDAMAEASSLYAIIIADRDGMIREWNEAAQRIFGYRAAEAIGQTIDLLMPEEERADHWRNYRRVMKTNIMNYTLIIFSTLRACGRTAHACARRHAERDP